MIEYIYFATEVWRRWIAKSMDAIHTSLTTKLSRASSPARVNPSFTLLAKTLTHPHTHTHTHSWAYPDMLQVGNLASFEHDRANFGAWIIISAPLYLSFDLRDATRLDRAWQLITNTEAIAVSQQYEGHPGWLVKSWTPKQAASSATDAAGNNNNDADLRYVVTTPAAKASCQTGWSFDAASGEVRKAGEGCLTVPTAAELRRFPSGSSACLLNQGKPWHIGDMYCDDAQLVIRPCVSSSAQVFTFSGTAPSSGIAPKAGLLSWRNATDTASVFSVRAQPWYEGAGVQLTAAAPRPLLFTAEGRLTTAKDFDSGKVLYAQDTCVGSSSTMSDAEALMLWAKPQPNGSIAVFLLNSHPTKRYEDVSFTLADVRCEVKGAQEAAVRDIWHQKDAPASKGGVVKLTVEPRDSAFVLLRPQQPAPSTIIIEEE